jgi:hypothetical protein
LTFGCFELYDVIPNRFSQLANMVQQNRFAYATQPQEHLAFFWAPITDSVESNFCCDNDFIPAR